MISEWTWWYLAALKACDDSSLRVVFLHADMPILRKVKTVQAVNFHSSASAAFATVRYIVDA